MPNGTQAVEDAIRKEFGAVEINKRKDPDTDCDVLSFRINDGRLIAYISEDFDLDFPNVDDPKLTTLGQALRQWKIVAVNRAGITEHTVRR